MRAIIGLIRRVVAGLRFRLLVLIVLACAPLVVLMLHTAWQDRRREENRWYQESHKLLQVNSQEEQELVGGTRQLLLALAESAAVRGLNRPACKQMIDEVFASYPRYANLGLILTNGQVLTSALSLPQGLDLSDRSFFRRTLAAHAFAVGDFPVAVTNGRPTITFGYPALNRSGQVQAVVFAQLDLNWYSRYGSELPAHLPKGATWMEIDRNGIVLTRYPRPENWVGRRLPNASLVQTAFSSSGGVAETFDPKGIPLFYAYRTTTSQLASGPVTTILSIPKKLLFAEADRNLLRNLTWLGIAAGLALVLGWIGSKLLILRPVSALVRSSARLATGDLSARTGLTHTRDELGQLTRAFDQMAQALEEREQARQRADQKLQVLSHRLVEVQETERRHIARELHDE
ncbi:MAG TPA: HAMP domain-containing protein, partial [Bacillota bacterium]|nr:HAMP domain-containing protein [Bacillota bacterium]